MPIPTAFSYVHVMQTDIYVYCRKSHGDFHRIVSPPTTKPLHWVCTAI